MIPRCPPVPVIAISCKAYAIEGLIIRELPGHYRTINKKAGLKPAYLRKIVNNN
jgi:hypothetical protein